MKSLIASLALAAPLSTHAQTKVDFALYAADATIRSLDTVSTHALLDSPCRCFRESDPLSPNSRHVLPVAAFQTAAFAGVVQSSRMLTARHHARLGRLVLLLDIAAEVYAVQGNVRAHEPAKAASNGLLAAPINVKLP